MKKAAQEQQKNSTKRVVGKPFKKGESPNPGGRPKGSTSFKIILERLGIQPSTADPKKTRDEAIALKAYELAEQGDKWAIQFVVERREGKPGQSIDYTEHKLEPLEGIIIE